MNLHQTIWFTFGTQNIYLPSRSMCLAGILDKDRPELSDYRQHYDPNDERKHGIEVKRG